LVVEKEISFTQAVFGTEVDVPTLEGKSLHVKIPPGTQPQSKLRLKGYGLPILGGKGKGDQFVKILIKVPKKISDHQRKLLEELSREGF
jgi:curved DNA-binding protein